MWVLIILVFSSIPSRGVSISVESVPGFKAESTCKAAGEQMEKMATPYENVRYVCAKQ